MTRSRVTAPPGDYDPDVVHAGADRTAHAPSDVAFRGRIATAAAQGGGALWCPATGTGGYVLAEPLDLANLGDRPIRIDGDGQVGENGTGTVIIPDTGALPAFDATGTSALRLARFTIKSEARANGAKLLILMGRTARWQFPQGHHYEDVTLYAGSDRTSHGGVGTIALANISCEHFHAENVRAKADVPFYLHGFNDLKLTAPHGGVLTGPWSMTMATLMNCSGYAFGGPAFDLADCDNIVLLNCHAQRDPASTSAYAIQLAGRIQAVRMIGGQIEQFPGAVELRSDAVGCEFATLIGSPTAPCVHLANDITVASCTFRISQINGRRQPLFSNARATILGGDVHLERGQLAVSDDGEPRVTFRGVSIHSADDEPVHVTADSTYTVNAPGGWYSVTPARYQGRV